MYLPLGANKLPVFDELLPSQSLPKSLQVGKDYFVVQVRNFGKRPVSLSVFDVQPDGNVIGFWPDRAEPRELPAHNGLGEPEWYTLANNGEFYHPKLLPEKKDFVFTFFVSAPFGLEMIKALATHSRSDLTPLADYWLEPTNTGFVYVSYGGERVEVEEPVVLTHGLECRTSIV